MDKNLKYNEIYETLKILLREKIPDHDKVKSAAGSILNLHKSFPTDLRFQIWEVLLDVSERTEPDFDMMTKAQARFSNDSVLVLDVERSFNSVNEPRKSELRGQLTTIISTYCAKYDVAYWQGMHDMVSVMLLMDPQPPLSRIFLLFSMFLQTFLPYVFDDRDCMFLKHIFEMIRLLLQYHDPQLSIYLQKHQIFTAIYSPSWLLTLFSHDVSQTLLLTIWDQYIFYKNPATHVFTILAHLCENKARILAYPASELPELMTHLPFENDSVRHVFGEERKEMEVDANAEESDEVCRTLTEQMNTRQSDATVITDVVLEGLKLMQRTPSGFIHRLNEILNDRITVSAETLEFYRSADCVMATPVEIYTFLVRDIDKNANCLRYLLLDTRGYATFRRSHITQSKNVSSQTLMNLEKMDVLLRKVRSHEYHVVVLDDSSDSLKDGNVGSEFVDFLLRRGCKYVSRMMGGYDRIIKLIRSEEGMNVANLITEETGVRGSRLILLSSYIEDGKLWYPPQESVRVRTTKEIEEKEGSIANSSPQEISQDLVKTVEGKQVDLINISDEQCLLYAAWLDNPQVEHYICKKVQKVKKDEKEVFLSSSEKIIVLTNGFMFIIDINNCPETGYAIVESRYSFASIETIKESAFFLLVLYAAGKDYIYMVTCPNNDLQKKKLLFFVEKRDDCVVELKKRMQQ